MTQKRRFFRCLLPILTLFLLLGAPLPARAVGQEALAEAILQSYLTEAPADLTALHVTSPELLECFTALRTQGRLPWYSTGSYQVSCLDGTNLVLDFTPGTLDPAVYDRTVYTRTTAEILHDTLREDMDQWQIALALHDYLAIHGAYDETLTRNTGYDLIVNGTGTCRSYALAYMDLMNRAGIPCILAESETMAEGNGHVWNLVRIYGKWYHVDVTWDDPLPDIRGYAEHRYFLLTDEEIRSQTPEGHRDWETDIVCSDLQYANAFWRDVTGPICYQDADTSFYRILQNRQVYTLCRSEKDGSVRTIHIEKNPQISDGRADCSLSLWDGKLYLTSGNTVSVLSQNGETPVCCPEGKQILGSYTDQGRIFLTLAGGEAAEIPLENPGHLHSYITSASPATCTEAGFTQFTCDCGIRFRAEIVPPLGHDYRMTMLEEPGFTKQGLARYQCTRCGDSYEERVANVDLMQFVLEHLALVTLVILIPPVLLAVLMFYLFSRKKK